MQGTVSEPRQIRKEATVGNRFLCRSAPGLLGEVLFFSSCPHHKPVIK